MIDYSQYVDRNYYTEILMCEFNKLYDLWNNYNFLAKYNCEIISYDFNVLFILLNIIL